MIFILISAFRNHASVTPLLLPPKAVQRWDHFVPPSRDGDVYIEGETLQRQNYRGMKWQYKKAFCLNLDNQLILDSDVYVVQLLLQLL